MTEIITTGQQQSQTSLTVGMTEEQIVHVVHGNLYPTALKESVLMVIAYCKAQGLDPLQKPVHIVPMWDGLLKRMRDVIMPGIGLYRTIAARSGCMGISEPEFGPEITTTFSGQEIKYPQWCRVTVKRKLNSGEVAEFTAKEFWTENYAAKGGAEKSTAPNAMWSKRPHGQIAKCAEAQALRKAFPEVGSQATADEMMGKSLNDDLSIEASTVEESGRKPPVATPQRQTAQHSVPVEISAKPRQPAANAIDESPATKGEIAFLTRKIADANLNVSDAFTNAGLTAKESLVGLSTSEFKKIKVYLEGINNG